MAVGGVAINVNFFVTFIVCKGVWSALFHIVSMASALEYERER